MLTPGAPRLLLGGFGLLGGPVPSASSAPPPPALASPSLVVPLFPEASAQLSSFLFRGVLHAEALHLSEICAVGVHVLVPCEGVG